MHMIKMGQIFHKVKSRLFHLHEEKSSEDGTVQISPE